MEREEVLDAFRTAATMVDVWKRGEIESGGGLVVKPAGVAQHAIVRWQNGPDPHLALVAGSLKTAFGQ